MGMDGVSPEYFNPWFGAVAERVALAHWHHKHGDHHKAILVAGCIAARDWNAACTEWLDRRRK
jgi:hypothetical protein